MGMYDEVICEYPLPDGYDATGIVFQTKDLSNDLDRWTIKADGELLDSSGRLARMYGESVNGTVRLVYSNGLYSGGGFVATVDNSSPLWWAYAFTFTASLVTGVTGGSSPLEGTHIPREEFWDRVP